MELNDLKWQGYLRKDGRLGIRNRVLVVYTVKCAEFVARRIVEEARSLDAELAGFDGCTDNQYAVNLLISLIRHPNVGTTEGRRPANRRTNRHKLSCRLQTHHVPADRVANHTRIVRQRPLP